MLALEKTGLDIDGFKNHILTNLAATRARTGRGRILWKSGHPDGFTAHQNGMPYWHRPMKYRTEWKSWLQIDTFSTTIPTRAEETKRIRLIQI